MTQGQVLGVLRAHERELRERFAVRSLELFGSTARDAGGEASDVDLLVEFDRPIGLLHLSGTACYLEDLIGRRVDLVLRRAVLPELRARIYAEAIRAFGAREPAAPPAARPGRRRRVPTRIPDPEDRASP